MIKDKIQKAYDKMLIEARGSFKYIGKANDAMADFLEELEYRIPGPKDPKGSQLIKMFHTIDKDWEELWDKIVKLARQL